MPLVADKMEHLSPYMVLVDNIVKVSTRLRGTAKALALKVDGPSVQYVALPPRETGVLGAPGEKQQKAKALVQK